MLNNIFIIIGPMASGKSTFAKSVAKELNSEFVDTDKTFVSRYGSISKYFSEYGESNFRAIELDILKELVIKHDFRKSNKFLLVATGGGIVVNKEAREFIKKHATKTIYFKTNFEYIKKYIQNSTRPLLTGNVNAWQEIYDERKPYYEELADFIFDTSVNTKQKTTKIISEYILGHLDK